MFLKFPILIFKTLGKMQVEPEYNWNIILRSSLPVSAVLAWVFFTDIRMNLKWFLLVLGLITASLTVYFQDKKKQNVFTAVCIVLLISLLIHALKRLGIF